MLADSLFNEQKKDWMEHGFFQKFLKRISNSLPDSDISVSLVSSLTVSSRIAGKFKQSLSPRSVEG